MKYIRMHQVEAEPMTRGDYNKFRGWTIPADENPADDGYKVTYPDGYISWCPKVQFEAAGRLCDGMTFGMAIEAMKRGKKVARKGWNCNWRFVRIEEVLISADDDGIINLGVENEKHEFAECFMLHIGCGDVQVGWTASQTDVLAEDWTIVE